METNTFAHCCSFEEGRDEKEQQRSGEQIKDFTKITGFPCKMHIEDLLTLLKEVFWS